MPTTAIMMALTIDDIAIRAPLSSCAPKTLYPT
jgi:hypothetical protein